MNGFFSWFHKILFAKTSEGKALKWKSHICSKEQKAMFPAVSWSWVHFGFVHQPFACLIKSSSEIMYPKNLAQWNRICPGLLPSLSSSWEVKTCSVFYKVGLGMGRPANFVKVVINVTTLFLLNVSNIGDNLFLPHFSSNRKNKTEIFSDIWLSMLSEDEP